MKNKNYIGNKGIFSIITHKEIHQHFQWNVDIIYIKLNMGSRLQEGFNTK